MCPREDINDCWGRSIVTMVTEYIGEFKDKVVVAGMTRERVVCGRPVWQEKIMTKRSVFRYTFPIGEGNQSVVEDYKR